jgi:hypothetical protein
MIYASGNSFFKSALLKKVNEYINFNRPVKSYKYQKVYWSSDIDQPIVQTRDQISFPIHLWLLSMLQIIVVTEKNP